MDEQKQIAFMKAYEPCHESFMRYCSALAFGKMDVEDLVQEILLSAYKHFDKIQQKDQFLHYLIRAARYKAINKNKRSKSFTELAEIHGERLRGQGVEPEMLIDIQFMYKAMEKLPARQREALILFEISGFSMKEIAEIQKSSPGAIKTKISRGRKRLRELMEEKSPTHSMNGIFGTLYFLCL